MEITIYTVFGQLLAVSGMLGYIIWRLENPKKPTVSVKEFQRLQRESGKEILSRKVNEI